MWDYGDDNRGPELAAVALAMAAVSILAVSLRSYTMATILKRFLIEDWLAVLTCLLQLAFSALVVIGVSYGLGAHVEHVPEENRHKALVYKWAGQIAYIVVSTIVKFVVGIFILRLCVNNNWQRITILVLLVIVGLFNAFYVFIAMFQCQPIAFYWWRYTPNPPVSGKCNGHALATIPTYFAVLIGIAADLILALLPATLIKGAKLDQRTKISVCCILALGSLASVATIARIPYAKQLLSNPDYLFNFTDLAIWSIVECGIAITASSMATLRPLLLKMKLLAMSRVTRYGHSRYGSAGLPIQSANTVTIISNSRAQSTKRNTVMTGTTAVTGGTQRLSSVREGYDGKQMDEDFEMSPITKETSQDSIDRLEAEVDEVINPGSARCKSNYGLNARSRLGPLQTSFPATSEMAPTTPRSVSAASVSSGHHITRLNSSSPASPAPRTQRRPSDGITRDHIHEYSPREGQYSSRALHGDIGSAYTDTTVMQTPPPIPRHHQHTYSDGSRRSAGVTFSPPSFHLPTRLQHQSVISNSVVGDFRGTIGGLSAPPRILNTGQGEYTPSSASSPLESPVSFGSRPSRSLSGSSTSQAHGSPTSNTRFPFTRQDTIQELPERVVTKRGKQRVSAFLADADSSSYSSTEEHEEDIEQQPRTPQWRSAPREIPSPLRSHPPRSPKGNWL